jgi:hypothetical protein
VYELNGRLVMGNNQVRIKYIIQVGNTNKKWWQFWKKSGTTPKQAEEAIAKLMESYKEDIKWDDEKGEVSLNDTKIPFQKEYWIPSKEENVDITITFDENGNLIKKNNDKI